MRGPRLLAVDATCWDVDDSPANEAAFGYPGNSRGHGESCLSQVRTACLSEVATHLVLDAERAGCRTGEVTLVNRLPCSCGPGQLVLSEREFLGVPLWRAFTDSGSDLLWRVPVNHIRPVDRTLRDGSWLSHTHAHTDRSHSDPVTVRMVTCQLHGTGRAAEDYRLVTTMFTMTSYVECMATLEPVAKGL